mgnify:CR=1 FL=1
MTEKDLIIQDLRRENAELRARVPKWISVDERLPEKDGAYLTAIKHFGKHRGIDIRSFAKDGETVDEYELAGQKYVIMPTEAAQARVLSLQLFRLT